MLGRPRVHLDEVPMHLVQRGRNREPCFFAEEDYFSYLHWLEEALVEHDCALHATVLMTNHVHLLLTPKNADALPKLIMSLGWCYVQYISHTCKRIGALWMRNYFSSFLRAFILATIMFSLIAKAENMSASEEFKIQFDESKYADTKEFVIHGAFTTFVNCGSQYAIWFQFPDAVRYTLKDLDSGEVYQSINRELSISRDGNQVYDEYAKTPCNKVIEKEFSVALSDVYFMNSPKKAIKNFELHADYAGHKSNTILFKVRPFFLKEF
jgi:REP element-mobilizing transposase RayT